MSERVARSSALIAASIVVAVSALYGTATLVSHCDAEGPAAPPGVDHRQVLREMRRYQEVERARAAYVELLSIDDDFIGPNGETLGAMTCNPRNLTARLEIVGGSYSWPSELAAPELDKDPDARSGASWRKTAAVSLSYHVEACLRGHTPLVRQRASSYVEAFGAPGVVSLMRRMLAGTPYERDVVLEILHRVPVRALYAQVAVLARAGEARARYALVALDDVPEVYDVPKAWASWIDARAEARSQAAFQSLLDVATGRVPASAPAPDEGTAWLEVRRSAAQAARMWQQAAASRMEVPQSTVDLLLSDEDAKLRREGVQLVSQDENVRQRLATIATTDADARVRIAAYLALPTEGRPELRLDRAP